MSEAPDPRTVAEAIDAVLASGDRAQVVKLLATLRHREVLACQKLEPEDGAGRRIYTKPRPERGAVHTFQATYTVKGADGGRELRRTSAWYWRFWYEGKAYQGGPGRTTRDEARELGEQRKAELRGGIETDWRKVLVRDLYAIASAYKVTWKASTCHAFEACWKHITAFFPSTSKVRSIDDTALLRYVGQRKEQGAATNTIRLELQKLRRAMTLAHHKRILPWVPPFPRLKREWRDQTITPAELELILSQLPAHYRPMFEAALEMGWRTRSELATRRWTDIEWGPPGPGWVVLQARDSKTGQRRVFPMTARLREILEGARARAREIELRTGHPVPWVFSRDDGRPIGEYRFAWIDALKRAGFGKLEGRKGPWSNAKVVHDLRRSAIRRFERVGIARSASQGMVGHGDERTFSGYAGRGADPEALAAAAAKLDAAAAVGAPATILAFPGSKPEGA